MARNAGRGRFQPAVEVALGTAENNEPIHRAEGREDLADHAAVAASELRQAIAILTAADNGPIWPAPTP